MNTFWKSRKFAYAAGTLLAAIVLTMLPSIVDLDAATRAMLDEALPLIFVLGFLVIGGHTATDLLATWREGVPSKDLATGLHDLIDTFRDLLAPGEIEVINPETGETLKVTTQPRLVLTGNGEAIAGELLTAEAPDLDAIANLAAEKAVAKIAHEAQGREAVR
jgi:hypothetical protein